MRRPQRHVGVLLLVLIALLSGCSSSSHGTKAIGVAVKAIPIVSHPTRYPTVIVTKGSATPGPGCNTNCFHLHITVSNVKPGRYAYDCANVDGAFYSGHLDVTSNDFDAPCFTQAGYEMPVSVQLFKVPFGGTTATIRSSNATW